MIEILDNHKLVNRKTKKFKKYNRKIFKFNFFEN